MLGWFKLLLVLTKSTTMASYIEFDSTYRDRNRWPSAGEFEMPISQTGRKGKANALDPVCLSAPIRAWTSNLIDASLAGDVLTGGTIQALNTPAAADNIGASSNGSDITLISAGVGDFQQTTDYYAGLVFNDTTIGVLRRIFESKYLGLTSTGLDRMVLVLSNPLPDTFALGDAWQINDPTDFADTSEPLIFVPNSSLADNAYVDCLLYNETRSEYRPVSAFTGTGRIMTLDLTTSAGGAVATWAITDNLSIRCQPPIHVTTIAAGVTTTTMPLTAGSAIDNFYTNNFVRIRATTYGIATVAPETESRRIIAYDGATLTLTVSPPFSAVPVVGDTIEILEFSHDNLNPFSYSGGTVSQQQMVCYELELLNLVLPNDTLTVGISGGRISFYPYLYVELTNVSASGAGMKNVIWSNNPNATRALFRAAVDDIANPIISAFIKIDGDGMVQTVKFNPNDNLKIKITLKDGQVYKTIIDERFSPLAPNPRGQISGVFLARRLS